MRKPGEHRANHSADNDTARPRCGEYFAYCVEQVNEWPALPVPGVANTSQVLYTIDLSKVTRLEKFAENARSFELTADGGRILFARNQNWFLVSTSTAPKPDEGRIDFKKLEVQVDPKAEWKQTYREAWGRCSLFKPRSIARV